ncbi:MAG: GNAT family protein [Actinomycetota bacterium]
MSSYAPLNVEVITPTIELRGATDERIEALAPLVAAGGATADPAPWDDPSPFYEPDPERRVQLWMRAIWRARGTVRADLWRLAFVVFVDGSPVGQQDLTGHDFDDFGSVETTSWVSSEYRRRGIGTEMRAAILHLAFEGLGAREAHSEGAVDNLGSNLVSERLGYGRNGVSWATHQGEPRLGQRWRLVREDWEARRRDDIDLRGTDECRRALGIDEPDSPGSAPRR